MEFLFFFSWVGFFLEYFEISDADVSAAADEDATDVDVSGTGSGRQRHVTVERVSEIDPDFGHIEEELEDLDVSVAGGDDEGLLRRFRQRQLAVEGVGGPVARQEVAHHVEVSVGAGVEQGAGSSVIDQSQLSAVLDQHPDDVAVAPLGRQRQRRHSAAGRRVAVGAELEEDRHQIQQSFLGGQAQQRTAWPDLGDVIRRRSGQ